MNNSASSIKLNQLISKINIPASGSSKKAQKAKNLILPDLEIILATIGLLIVLFSFISFLLWEVYTNRELVQQVKNSSNLNNSFVDANFALIEEDAFGHKYLYEPNPVTKAEYNQASTKFVAILGAARTTGDTYERILVDKILAVHESYLSSADQLFALVEANPKVARSEIDQNHEITDAINSNLKGLVNQAVQDHKIKSNNSLSNLETTQSFILVTSPIALILALGLIFFFLYLMNNYKQRINKNKLVNQMLLQVNQTITSALEKEKELNDLKSRFISTASHEFRTPLTGILASTELLENYSQKFTEKKKTEIYARMKTAITYMTRLIEDMLLIGQADTCGIKFNPVMLDLTQFCITLVEEVQSFADSKHSINFISPLPHIAEAFDEKLLRNIFVNLLSNAVKYSPHGGTVYFELNKQAGQAVIQIRDQGIGIPQEDQSRLFENFHRGKNVSTIPGTGLGLSIVKKAVEAHGGQIDFVSEVDVGTTFTVKIPLEAGGAAFIENIASKELLEMCI
jgi:signal transduction histidine kinase